MNKTVFSTGLSVQMFNFIAGGDWKNVRDISDIEKILCALAGAGFKGIEWCNFQFSPELPDVSEIKPVMDDLGLKTSGYHFHYNSADTLTADAELAVRRCHALGCDKIIFAFSLPSTFGIEPDSDGKYTPEQIDEWALRADEVIDELRKACSSASPDAKIKVLYHNHNTELLKGTKGKYFLDMIHPDGKEMDIYWIAKGLDGRVSSAIEYVLERKEEVMLLHMKDGLDGSVFTGEMCGWGKGTYPLQKIIDLAKELKLEWVVAENDAPFNFGTDGLTDALQTAEYAEKYLDL